MAKISIKSEKLTPFGRIVRVRELFSRYVGSVVDKELNLRSTSFEYQYCEIVGFLSRMYRGTNKGKTCLNAHYSINNL